MKVHGVQKFMAYKISWAMKIHGLFKMFMAFENSWLMKIHGS